MVPHDWFSSHHREPLATCTPALLNSKVERVRGGASGPRPPLRPSPRPEPLWSVLCLCLPEGWLGLLQGSPSRGSAPLSDGEEAAGVNESEQTRKSPQGLTLPACSAALNFEGQHHRVGVRGRTSKVAQTHPGLTWPLLAGSGALVFPLSTQLCLTNDTGTLPSGRRSLGLQGAWGAWRERLTPMLAVITSHPGRCCPSASGHSGSGPPTLGPEMGPRSAPHPQSCYLLRLPLPILFPCRGGGCLWSPALPMCPISVSFSTLPVRYQHLWSVSRQPAPGRRRCPSLRSMQPQGRPAQGSWPLDSKNVLPRVGRQAEGPPLQGLPRRWELAAGPSPPGGVPATLFLGLGTRFRFCPISPAGSACVLGGLLPPFCTLAEAPHLPTPRPSLRSPQGYAEQW